MKLINKLLGLNHIYIRPYPVAIVAWAMPLILLAFVIDAFVWDQTHEASTYYSDGTIAYLLIGVAVLLIIRSLIRAVVIDRRIKNRHFQSGSGGTPVHNSAISQSAASLELGSVTAASLVTKHKTYQIYDAMFGSRLSTPLDTDRIRDSYYTVFEGLLRRPVPHILFDAKKAKGKQFRALFIPSQKISFEGDFDKFFVAYSPDHYAVDTLSFISPEVMQAMMKLKYADIEIFQNRLLCYAPVLGKYDLYQFETHCKALHDHLNDNLDAYSDSWLPSSHNRLAVTSFGSQLQRSVHHYLPLLIISLAFNAIFVVALLKGAPSVILVNPVVLSINILLAYCLYKIITILHANKRARRHFSEYIQKSKHHKESEKA